MTNLRFGTVALFIVFSTAATSVARQTAPQAGAGSQQDTEAIASLLKQQVVNWNRGDIPSFMNGYWHSKYTEFVSDSGIFQGWEDVLQRYLHSYPNRAAMGHLTFSGLEIHLLCADSAYVVGEYRLDRQKDTPRGVFTLIFKKFPEGWRIVNDHTTAFRRSK